MFQYGLKRRSASTYICSMPVMVFEEEDWESEPEEVVYDGVLLDLNPCRFVTVRRDRNENVPV